MTSKFPQTATWLDGVSADELRRTVDVLYRVHRLVFHITDHDTLLKQILDESKQLADAEACSLLLYDPHADDLFFHVALGEHGDQRALIREVRLKLGQGIGGTAAAERKSINVRDARQDPRFYREADAASRFETRNLLAVPLIDRGELVGVIEVVNKIGGPFFTDTDLHVMEMFAGLVATSIANARLIQERLRTERLAAIGQAVAGLAHYAKNIITGMSGALELTDQGMAQRNQEFIDRSWPIVKRSVGRLADFVEDMLAYSKSRAPVWAPCDLAALIDDARQTVEATLARREQRIEVETDSLERPVELDARAMYRCLLNLLLNAADAAPRGTGVIRVRARRAEGAGVIIEVADNGPGVPEGIASRIFEPFFSTKGSQGTGLGLAVTQKIVREHGGSITVARAPEGGALFRIHIPPAPDSG